MPHQTLTSIPSIGMWMKMAQSLRRAASKNGATIMRLARIENTSGANQEASRPHRALKAQPEPMSTTSFLAMAESTSPTITTAHMVLSTKQVPKPKMRAMRNHSSKETSLAHSFISMTKTSPTWSLSHKIATKAISPAPSSTWLLAITTSQAPIRSPNIIQTFF